MRKVIEAIRKNKRFLITAHLNPEGDSICSQLAMKELLESIGKEAVIINHDEVPGHYKFLPKVESILTGPKDTIDFDAVIVLDCPTMKRIGSVESVVQKTKPVINIDHHISNEKFGTVNWVDANASSAGEMVYRLFKDMDIRINKEAALYLYIAILTDTGSFNYDNTSSVTHEIAGELLGYGLDPSVVSENVFERRSVEDIRFLGMVLATLKVNRAGDVAYLEITRKMLKETGADMAKVEGVVNYARSIHSVKIAILFKEDTRGAEKINVSFRSKSGVDVNKLAAYFGGGGHTKAAGCVVEGPLAEVENKVVAQAEEILKQKK